MNFFKIAVYNTFYTADTCYIDVTGYLVDKGISFDKSHKVFSSLLIYRRLMTIKYSYWDLFYVTPLSCFMLKDIKLSTNDSFLKKYNGLTLLMSQQYK